jgi:hypothetical protein
VYGTWARITKQADAVERQAMRGADCPLLPSRCVASATILGLSEPLSSGG